MSTTTIEYYTSNRQTAPRLAESLGSLFAAAWLAGAAMVRRTLQVRAASKRAVAHARDVAALRAYARSIEANEPGLARDLMAISARDLYL